MPCQQPRSLLDTPRLPKHPHDGVSSAQALMSRLLRSTLPIIKPKLKPSIINASQSSAHRQQQQRNQKQYYNRTATTLSPIQNGDVVRFKMDPNSSWLKAKVVAAHAAPRSYIIETQDGGQYRRNRRHLRKGNEQSRCNTAGAGVENLMPSKESKRIRTREEKSTIQGQAIQRH